MRSAGSTPESRSTASPTNSARTSVARTSAPLARPFMIEHPTRTTCFATKTRNHEEPSFRVSCFRAFVAHLYLLAAGPHPRGELTLTPRLGFARPRLGVAAGASFLNV